MRSTSVIYPIYIFYRNILLKTLVIDNIALTNIILSLSITYNMQNTLYKVYPHTGWISKFFVDKMWAKMPIFYYLGP